MLYSDRLFSWRYGVARVEALFGVDALQLASIFAIVLCAALIRSFTGFGFALVSVPGFSMILPPTEAVSLSASLGLAISCIGLRSFWGVVPIRSTAPVLATVLLGTLLGASLLLLISESLFQLLVGTAIFAACGVLHFLKAPKSSGSRPAAMAAGLASGLMNGALSIPGPPIIAYVMFTENDPVRSRAYLMTFFMLSSAMALVVFISAGFFKLPMLLIVLCALPLLYLSDRIGYALFQRYSSSLYRQASITVLLIMGVSLIANALLSL